MLDYGDVIIHCNSGIIPKYVEYPGYNDTRLQSSAYSMYLRILQMIDHYEYKCTAEYAALASMFRLIMMFLWIFPCHV